MIMDHDERLAKRFRPAVMPLFYFRGVEIGHNKNYDREYSKKYYFLDNKE